MDIDRKKLETKWQGKDRTTLFALFSEGTVQYAENYEYNGGMLLPWQRNNEVLKQIRLPSAASPFDSLQALMRGIETFIYRCVHIEDYYISVLADFVLSTWFIDRLSVASYLSVVGLPQSGKTTLLTTLSLLCRRSLLISDITSASFYSASTQFLPTVIIDEPGTIANNRQLGTSCVLGQPGMWSLCGTTKRSGHTEQKFSAG